MKTCNAWCASKLCFFWIYFPTHFRALAKERFHATCSHINNKKILIRQSFIFSVTLHFENNENFSFSFLWLFTGSKSSWRSYNFQFVATCCQLFFFFFFVVRCWIGIHRVSTFLDLLFIFEFINIIFSYWKLFNTILDRSLTTTY